MADIFGFNGSYGQSFKESEQGVVIGGAGALSLIQQWNIRYDQAVTPIYECGTSTVYWSMKHAAGQFSVNRIVAENPATITSILGDICAPTAPTVMAFTGQCAGATPVRATLTGCILTGIGLSGQAQQAYVGMDCTAQFTGLEIN